jgi:hypothetical protein
MNGKPGLEVVDFEERHGENHYLLRGVLSIMPLLRGRAQV